MTRPAAIEVGQTYRFKDSLVVVMGFDEFNVRWRRFKQPSGDKFTARAFFSSHATMAAPTSLKTQAAVAAIASVRTDRIGEMRLIAAADGYAMIRRPGSVPIVMPLAEWEAMPLMPVPSPVKRPRKPTKARRTR